MFLYYLRRLNPLRFIRRPRLTLRNVLYTALSIVVFAIFIGLALVFLVILPTQRAREIEESYFTELEKLASRESLYKWRISNENLARFAGEKPKPWNASERLLPLIHDVTQLSSWGYFKQMQLYEDGTAEYPMQEFWIYIAGTPSTRTNSFTNKSGSCDDPDYICDAYNDAFNRLLEYYHTHRVNTTSNAGLAFVDCDISPLLCSIWTGLNVNPVMLVHVRTASPCRFQLKPHVAWSCTVYWHYISLPLKHMPWSPTVRFLHPNGKLSAPLPVFPTQFEQLKALVGYRGAEEAFELEEWEKETYKPDLDDEEEGQTEEGQKLTAKEKSELGRKDVWDRETLGPVGAAFLDLGCYTAYGWRKANNWWKGVEEDLGNGCSAEGGEE